MTDSDRARPGEPWPPVERRGQSTDERPSTADVDAAWTLVLAAAQRADELGDRPGPVPFALSVDGQLEEVSPGDSRAVLVNTSEQVLRQ